MPVPKNSVNRDDRNSMPYGPRVMMLMNSINNQADHYADHYQGRYIEQHREGIHKDRDRKEHYHSNQEEWHFNLLATIDCRLSHWCSFNVQLPGVNDNT